MSSFLDSIKIAAVDTETSGVNPFRHELIEIGAVNFNLNEIEDRFEVLIKPEKKHDPKARKVHKISNEELESRGVGLSEAISRFLDFIGDRLLVFHNASFDLTFLKLSADKVKLELPKNTYYDNLFLSKKYYPERESHSLSSIRELLNLDTSVEHRALADAEATALSFMQILKEKGQGIDSRKSLQKFMRYNRKMHKFMITLPKNYDEIEKYFQRRIRGHEYIKVNYRDNKGQDFTHMVQPLEMMVFNQQLYIKVKVQMTAEEKLIPLKFATFFDPELGPTKF